MRPQLAWDTAGTRLVLVAAPSHPVGRRQGVAHCDWPRPALQLCSHSQFRTLENADKVLLRSCHGQHALRFLWPVLTPLPDWLFLALRFQVSPPGAHYINTGQATTCHNAKGAVLKVAAHVACNGSQFLSRATNMHNNSMGSAACRSALSHYSNAMLVKSNMGCCVSRIAPVIHRLFI